MAENTNQELNTEGLENKTYTAEEVQKLLQSESDKRVTEALKKKDKEYQGKLKESEKLARMNESEKADYEKQQFSKTLEDKEKELNIRENKIEGLKILSEKNIPATLIDFVIDPDAQVMHDRIVVLDKEIKKAVAAEVKSKISSASPRVAVTQSGEMTREQFKKLSFNEKNSLFLSNPELFKELTK